MHRCQNYNRSVNTPKQKTKQKKLFWGSSLSLSLFYVLLFSSVSESESAHLITCFRFSLLSLTFTHFPAPITKSTQNERLDNFLLFSWQVGEKFVTKHSIFRFPSFRGDNECSTLPKNHWSTDGTLLPIATNAIDISFSLFVSVHTILFFSSSRHSEYTINTRKAVCDGLLHHSSFMFRCVCIFSLVFSECSNATFI